MQAPKPLMEFKKRHPEVWETYQEFEGACGEGPLDEETQELINAAVSAALGNENATALHAANAVEAGAEPDAVRQAVLLVATRAGFPEALTGSFAVEEAIGE